MSGPTEGNLNSTTPPAPSGKQLVLWQAGSPYLDPVTGAYERDITAYPPSAASGVEGAIALAGDIGGSSTTPKVVGVQGVGVSATAPTNGQVLQYDSGSGLYKPATPGSSTPFAPFNAMLAPSGITPPVLASLTWSNQGSSAASYNAGGGLYMTTGAAGAGTNNIRTLYKGAPAAPWTFTVGYAPGMGFDSGGNQCGIVMRESATGKIIAFWCGNFGTSAFEITVSKYSGFTSLHTSYLEFTNASPAMPMYQQVSLSGTTFTWSVAIDGQNFKTFFTSTLTDYFTTGPDQIGFGINGFSSTFPEDAVVFHRNGI